MLSHRKSPSARAHPQRRSFLEILTVDGGSDTEGHVMERWQSVLNKLGVGMLLGFVGAEMGEHWGGTEARGSGCLWPLCFSATWFTDYCLCSQVVNCKGVVNANFEKKGERSLS